MWRWTHRFMGTFFAFSSFHYLFITKPFSVWEPVGLYISAFCLLGIVSYCYTLIPFSILQGRHKYKVSSAEQNGEGLSVTLQPVGRGLRHLPGQFAFVRFDGLGRNEVHPFTISKAPGSGNQIRFTIKPLGDDTQSLVREISTGQTAIVSNAFGHFTRRNNGHTEIWVAGGIGITPFVAFAEDLKSATGTVHLFYSVGDRKRAAHLRELEEIAAQRDGFNLYLVETNNQGRLDIAKLEEAMGSVPVDTVVYFCGPEEMRESLQKEFIAKNIPARRFRYEEFRIRTGIDYFAFFSWLLRRLWLQVEKVQKEPSA